MLIAPAQFGIVILLGLTLGSFTSALSYRVARGLPWRGGRSACPHCHAALTPLDLVPIFSWLALRGKCRHCGAAIGCRYPLIELTVVLSCVALYLAFGFNASLFVAIAAMPFLLTLLLVDIEQMILPDSMQVILAALGLVFAGLTITDSTRPLTAFASHSGACAMFAGLFWLIGYLISRLRRRDALGFGDVKFAAIAGLWLGLPFLSIFMMVGGVAGVACGIAWRLAGRGAVFPFGPALIIAFYGCLLVKGAGFSPLVLLH